MDFRIYSLKNIDYLSQIVQGMKGSVLLKIGANTPLNLKQSSEGFEILRCMTIGSEKVSLQITDPADRDSMVKYLIGS